MTASTFKTNPYDLHELLTSCHKGSLQLPDFQRSWVWDEDRIKSLIASISKAFPIGALMTLETGNQVDFKPRRIEGTPAAAAEAKPTALLLDGQQRMTALYQAIFGGNAVETITPKKKRVKRWFYIDIQKALDDSLDREDAILSVPENKILATNFGRTVLMNLTKTEAEFDQLLFPLSAVFSLDRWQDPFIKYWMKKGAFDEKWFVWTDFKARVLDNFIKYHVPVISLGSETTKEAVCVVFEKVNTGGKPLDVFELLTAMYAASNHELRHDWYGKEEVGKENELGRRDRLALIMRPPGQDTGIMSGVSNTDFLQAISLFHTRARRQAALQAGRQGKDLPQVTGNRQALLNLPLAAYKQYEKQVEDGFEKAAKFLHTLQIYRILDLPYQSQIVPLAAILADIGDDWNYGPIREQLTQWYWNGVFGELYGSSVDTRIARDFVEVPPWLKGGPLPSTIRDAAFRADRLETMRMRLSAAYKGVNALLMKNGARDFRSSQKFEHAVFFEENVDIHHIFPKAWCESRKLKPAVYDSIINKSPLGYRTNRAIGGDAPSHYLAKLERGTGDVPAIQPDRLDCYLRSHLIDPTLLRADDFVGFMHDRKQRLLGLIEQATGQKIDRAESEEEEGEDFETDEDTKEAKLTISIAA